MARVIEERIITIINNWKEGKHVLSIRDCVVIDESKAIYYLWGHPIVTIHKGIYRKKTVDFSFCGWGSQTTKQRISELLWYFTDCYIFRKNWIHYLKIGNDYYKIDEISMYTIKEYRLFDSIGNKVEPLKDFKR